MQDNAGELTTHFISFHSCREEESGVIFPPSLQVLSGPTCHPVWLYTGLQGGHSAVWCPGTPG